MVGLPQTLSPAYSDGATGFDPVAAGWTLRPVGPPVPLAGPWGLVSLALTGVGAARRMLPKPAAPR